MLMPVSLNRARTKEYVIDWSVEVSSVSVTASFVASSVKIVSLLVVILSDVCVWELFSIFTSSLKSICISLVDCY